MDATTETWTRQAGGGTGSSFVPLRQVAGDLATVNGEPWEGLVTLRWDPNEKNYFCPTFEAVFTQMYEITGGPANQLHNNFEVQFPRIVTSVSLDGQCLFAPSERPLRDAPAGNTGVHTIYCKVGQSNLLQAVKGGFLNFHVWPFRIATGYASAIRGPSRGTNFWTRVRNTEIAATLHTVQQGGAAVETDRNSLCCGASPLRRGRAQLCKLRLRSTCFSSHGPNQAVFTNAVV